MTVRESLVVDATEMEQRRLQVTNMHRILGHVESELVAAAVNFSRLYAAACHPDRECTWVMVAAVRRLIVDIPLNKWRSTKFTSPNHQRVVQHPVGFQVFDEGRAGLIRVAALVGQLLRQISVLVPTGMHQLDESRAALGLRRRTFSVRLTGWKSNLSCRLKAKPLSGFLPKVQ